MKKTRYERRLKSPQRGSSFSVQGQRELQSIKDNGRFPCPNYKNNKLPCVNWRNKFKSLTWMESKLEKDTQQYPVVFHSYYSMGVVVKARKRLSGL